MSSQIFKNQISKNMIYELLEGIGTKNEKYYTINNDSYKKGLFTNSVPLFMESCKPFYHISKQKYLDRKLTYNSFTTVLRQICNFNKINYTSQIKYDKSSYDIAYYIYFVK